MRSDAFSLYRSHSTYPPDRFYMTRINVIKPMVMKQITRRVCGSNEVTFKKISSSNEIRGTQPDIVLMRLFCKGLAARHCVDRKFSRLVTCARVEHENTIILVLLSCVCGDRNIRGKTRNGPSFVGRHIVKLRTSLEAKRVNGIGNDHHRTTCTEWMMCDPSNPTLSKTKVIR